jgi:hypothetical protein
MTGNVTPIKPQAYRLDLESLNDLAKMSRELYAYIEDEKNARRREELREIIEYLGDILSEVERRPVA